MAADSQSTVALNIGSQRIGMAVFEPSKGGGLVLKAYESSTILADPATEMSRIPQVQLAVNELVQRLKVGKGKVRYAISGQAVFTRFVKLPPLEDDNIEQIVTFEAQQHVPFPINEVVWDYQLIRGGETGEIDVMLAAIKAEQHTQAHVPGRLKSGSIPALPVKHSDQSEPEVVHQLRPTGRTSTQRIDGHVVGQRPAVATLIQTQIPARPLFTGVLAPDGP